MSPDSARYTARDLATRLGGTLDGDGDALVTGVGSLDRARPGDIVYAANRENFAQVSAGACAAILGRKRFADNEKTLILVDDPRRAYVACLELFAPSRRHAAGISPGARVAENARIAATATVMAGATVMDDAVIGERVVLWPGVFIGAGVTVGDDSELHPNAVVREQCVIGARVIIHPGAVIGADGFGYLTEPDGRILKIPQLGNVEIGDDVEIGANSAIDRATSGSTVIGAGTKIDNLVQVAHNVVLGRNNLLAAQTGIAGSTTTGEACMFAGQAGVADHCQFGDRVVVGPQAGVQLRHPKTGTTYFGTPAIEMERMRRILPLFHRLPELLAGQTGGRREQDAEGDESGGEPGQGDD